MAKMLIIGIAGGSGSGKSTIARLLSAHFGGSVTVIRHDDYYRAQHDIPFEERAKRNYDHPDAFDTDLLLTHLAALRRGETVECPVYDYMEQHRGDAHDRTGGGAAPRRDPDPRRPAPARLYGHQAVR